MYIAKKTLSMAEKYQPMGTGKKKFMILKKIIQN